MSSPICSYVNSVMQSIAQVGYETSEQHTCCDGPSRTERDNADISILTSTWKSHIHLREIQVSLEAYKQVW